MFTRNKRGRIALALAAIAGLLTAMPPSAHAAGLLIADGGLGGIAERLCPLDEFAAHAFGDRLAAIDQSMNVLTLTFVVGPVAPDRWASDVALIQSPALALQPVGRERIAVGEV